MKVGRRKHPRVAPLPKRPVEVQIIGDGFLEVLNAVDISMGGVGIVVPHGFDGCNTRDTVDIIVTFPSGRSVQGKGIIRHKTGRNTGNVFGVEFTSLSDKAKGRLQDYITLLLAHGRQR